MNSVIQMQPKVGPLISTGTERASNISENLSYLAQLDQVVVKQMKECFEIFTGCETRNRYQMMNSMGQQCYFALEESDPCL